MPILRNAKKALKVSKRKAKVNTPVRSRLKTTVDAAKKKAEPATLSSAFSAIDKAVRRHVIHRKKASRMKSQLAKRAAKTEAAPAPKAAAKPKAKASKK
ncbi:30S ribosomal protein S20 [Patescibacteria group bacterium]|nr:30S ribosomal protein S20 [Patescibacteria group bacterium]